MKRALPDRPAILLVDDNPHDVVLIRLAFRRVGIIDTIQLVKDGIEAVRYLNGDGIYADRQLYPIPTLMLLDLNMPHTSGFDVLRWIRARPQFHSLTIIVMTGSKATEDIQRAYTFGADSYLIKPSRFADLVKMMESLKFYCWPPGARMRIPGDREPTGAEASATVPGAPNLS